MPCLLDTLRELSARFTSLAKSTISESMVLGLPKLAWSSKFLQPEINILNHYITVLRSILPSLFAQKMFIFCAALWPSLDSQSVNSRIRPHSTFIWGAFKSHTAWRKAQRLSALYTTILPTMTRVPSVTQ